MLCSGMFHALGLNINNGAFSKVGTSSGWKTPFTRAMTLWSPVIKFFCNLIHIDANFFIKCRLNFSVRLPFTVFLQVGQWPSSKSTWIPFTPDVSAVMKWMELEGETSPKPRCWHCRRGGSGEIFQSSSECRVDKGGISSLLSSSRRLYLLVRSSYFEKYNVIRKNYFSLFFIVSQLYLRYRRLKVWNKFGQKGNASWSENLSMVRGKSLRSWRNLYTCMW